MHNLMVACKMGITALRFTFAGKIRWNLEQAPIFTGCHANESTALLTRCNIVCVFFPHFSFELSFFVRVTAATHCNSMENSRRLLFFFPVSLLVLLSLLFLLMIFIMVYARLHAALILILHAYVLLLLMIFGDKTLYALYVVHRMHFASTNRTINILLTHFTIHLLYFGRITSTLVLFQTHTNQLDPTALIYCLQERQSFKFFHSNKYSREIFCERKTIILLILVQFIEKI